MEFKMPERPENSHKGTFGEVLNISGSDYMPGAAYMSSVAALKTGCGYVFLCSTEKVISSVSAKTSNVVFVPLQELQKQLNNTDVILIGCGLTTKNYAKKLFMNVISNAGEHPVLIDADGLNILSGIKKIKMPSNTILTPHPKEAARLLKISVDEVLSNPQNIAESISKKYNCTTVLKLHNTVVCSKDCEIYINNTGNSGLAKAGSGDVLAGIIAGLLAQGCNTFYAAKLGVYLHGLCADILKESLTEYSIMPEDLINCIPEAIKKING